MRAYVVVATKGRPKETAILLERLLRQTRPPERVVVVGAELSDVHGIDDYAQSFRDALTVTLSDRAGLPIQRNVGLEMLAKQGVFEPEADGCFVAFFDDDFRPADDWLAAASEAFESASDCVGLTGRVLADGVRVGGVSEADAEDFLAGRKEPQEHWASGDAPRSLTSMYGCNMAFRDIVFRNKRFDERLPLYGWQEDRDFTGQAAEFGECLYIPDCQGVHLGVTGGRGSGVRLGYSQVANLAYLCRKGTVPLKIAAKLIFRSLGSNTVRSLREHALVDYRGRLKGNLIACVDLLTGRCKPERVLDL